MEKTKKITCDCGAIIQQSSINAHMKSKKHSYFMTNPYKIKIKRGVYVMKFD